MSELRKSNFAPGGARGEIAAAVLSSADGQRQAVQQGMVVLDKDLTVQFGGQAPPEVAKELEAAVRELGGSISKRGG